MLGRKVEMGQEDLAILEQLVDRLGVLRTVGRRELVNGQVGYFLVLGVHDRVQRRLHLRLQAGGYGVQDVGDLVKP